MLDTIHMFYHVDNARKRLIVSTLKSPPPDLMRKLPKDLLLHHGFIVFDFTTREWIGRYVAPQDWTPQSLTISPNGAYFACFGRVGSFAKRNVAPELLIYNLASLPHKVTFESLEKWKSRIEREAKEINKQKAASATTQKVGVKYD